MVRARSFAALATVALLAIAAEARGQASSPYRFGVMGGWTYPEGDYGNFIDHGWNVGGIFSFGLPLVPLSFRADFQYHDLGSTTRSSGGANDSHVFDGTVDVIYALGPATPLKFYVIGGVGLYNTSNTATTPGQPDQSASVTKFGLNIGVGVKVSLPVVTPFIEARYHYVPSGFLGPSISSSALEIVPISIGVVF